MLAIVAPSFNRVSETFVLDHVRRLNPHATALVCLDSAGTESFGHPVLSHFRPDYAAASGRLARWQGAVRERLQRRLGFGPMLGFEDSLRLAEFFRAQGVSVVLAEFGDMGVYINRTCAALDLPLYVYFRGHDASAQLRWPSMRRGFRRLFGHARGIVTVSRFLADRLVEIGCPEALIHVNPSGVRTDLFHPGRPEPGRILAVGRLVEGKAPHLTLRAFAMVARTIPEARLDMVGTGPLDELCRAVIADHRLEGRVVLHGARDHGFVAELMSRAAVFAQHSVVDAQGTTEGFPTAIAEAMSSALPVVATRHSGIPEHVVDGVSGFLVGEGDVEAMAAAMARLLADPARAADMGMAGRQHALVHLDRERSHRRLREIMGLASPCP
jgi:colanic acid/amylovoran biosynthesis glycosyltransferase